MPARLKTPCRYPRCPRTCHGGFCDVHASYASQRPADQRRPSPSKRGYDRRWERLRRWHLAEHPLCQDCIEQGMRSPSRVEVDHIIPIAVRPDLRLDSDNLRTLCRLHHRRKTERDRHQYGA